MDVDEEVDLAIEECVGVAGDMFALFYRPYLADYARQFLASTARTEGLAATTDLPGVVRTQLLSVMGDLSTVGKCALIAAYRGQRGDATPMGYGAFHRWISDGAGRGRGWAPSGGTC